MSLVTRIFLSLWDAKWNFAIEAKRNFCISWNSCFNVVMCLPWAIAQKDGAVTTQLPYYFVQRECRREKINRTFKKRFCDFEITLYLNICIPSVIKTIRSGSYWGKIEWINLKKNDLNWISGQLFNYSYYLINVPCRYYFLLLQKFPVLSSRLFVVALDILTIAITILDIGYNMLLLQMKIDTSLVVRREPYTSFPNYRLSPLSVTRASPLID